MKVIAIAHMFISFFRTEWSDEVQEYIHAYVFRVFKMK